jgi:serine/threonine protein kinase
MPTDRVSVPGGTIELVELMHLTRNSEIWLCEVKDVPGRFVTKFGLTRDSRACLIQETDILRRLDSLGIEGVLMPLWDLSIVTGSDRALTFPYVAEGSLAALMERRGVPLPLKEVNGVIMPQLLRTFAGLHRMKPPVVHSDVKPHNILVDRTRDGQPRFVVNDCGASAVQPNAPAEGETEFIPTSRAATPSYASLEQLSGWQPSVSDDLHALCVVWCRLLGVDPFDDTRLPARFSPIHWKERQRPGLQGMLEATVLTEDQVAVILDGLRPGFQRPSCEKMLRVLNTH